MRGVLVHIEAVKGRPLARKIRFQGLEISVETDKGQVRHWYDADSDEHGSTKMQYPYGYFCGLKEKGADGDQLDVFVGPVEDAADVFVIHQMKKPDFTEFDEDKVMVGFESEKQARNAYLQHFNDDRFLGSIETMSIVEFKNQFVKKALPGAFVGQVIDPNQTQPSAPGSFSLPVGTNGGYSQNMNNPAPLAQGIPMGPPPIDVESFEGVQSLLGRVSGMKDQELLRVVGDIWGDGYQFIQATPEHVRAEVVGFLLDQRDLLGVAPQELEEINPFSMVGSQDSSPSSQTSTAGDNNEVTASVEENSSGAASNLTPSTSSSQPEFSQKPEVDPFASMG